MECSKHSCHLTALWQIGLSFQPRWDTTLSPKEAWTSLVVCGMCVDDVTLDTMGEYPVAIATALTGGEPDSVWVTLTREDISDGLWRDPKAMGHRVPMS